MIRVATEKGIPAMLAICRPYVENTTYSFEYGVPCARTFTQRFSDHLLERGIQARKMARSHLDGEGTGGRRFGKIVSKKWT